jgi:hypothetical protein
MSGTVWSLRGDVLENCSCDIVCPGHFSFRNKCTHEYCHAVWAFRTSAGRYDGTDLAGLGVVLIGATPPYMIDGGWKVALYVDETAGDRQVEAIERIFSGAEGGPWATLARFVATRHPTKRAPIRYAERVDGRLGSVEIPGILRATAEPIRGQDRTGIAALVNLFNVLYEPHHVIARGSIEYRDHGFDWSAPERGNHAILTTFDWREGGTA